MASLGRLQRLFYESVKEKRFHLYHFVVERYKYVVGHVQHRDRQDPEREVQFMSDYMINGVSNPVKIGFRSYSDPYTDKKNVVRTCDRFLRAAAALPEDEYLGWEIAVDKAGAPSNLVFSSKSVDISIGDYKWIFESSAAVTSGISVSMGDNFQKDRLIYKFTYNTASKETEHRRDNERGYFSYEYGDSDTLENFINLLEMMKGAGGIFFRLLVRGDGNGCVKGVIVLLSLPSPMTLRMKAALSMAFPLTVIREADLSEANCLWQNIPTDLIVEGMIGLQQVLMYYGDKAEADTDKNVTEEKSSVNECNGDKGLIWERDPEETVTDERKPGSVSKTPIEDMELSVRPYNCLKRAGVDTVEKLRVMNEEDLAKVRNLGRRSIIEIKARLAALSEQEKKTALTAVNYKTMLDELIGLEAVKEQIKKITAYARMKQDMESSGRPGVPMVLNMEFIGNPGTAKTTVARILAGILHEIGLLSTGNMVEAGRADLIAEYEGQTAEKVREVFKKAQGKLLFIDEAYSLVEQWEGAYGDEAIDTIVQEMENHRDETIVVFAGYPEEMEEFFSRNPGLRSRVPFQISFQDYSAEEMERICEMEAEKRGFSIGEEAKERIMELCKAAKAVANAGNGRFCRNLVESAILGYASRMYGEEDIKGNRDYVLIGSDFSEVLLPAKKKAATSIGFRIA